jgi:hypothetical protein
LTGKVCLCYSSPIDGTNCLKGFTKQQLRSETVRTILGGSTYTRNFHSDCAKLTAKIALLLQPLSTYLYALRPTEEFQNPNIQDQFQSLHNIVSTAAYLSICMRLSPTIVSLVSVNPGTYFDPDDHRVIDKAGYIASRAIATDAYHSQRDTWLLKHGGVHIGSLTDRTALRKTMKDNERDNQGDLYVDARTRLATILAPGEIAVRAKYAGFLNITTPPPKISDEDDEAEVLLPTEDEVADAQREIDKLDSDQPVSPTRTHRAMCKIALWPSIRRYKAGGPNQDRRKLENRDGFRIREITKAVVSDYFGETDVQKRMTRQRLAEFVEKKKKFGRERKEFGQIPSFVLGASVAAAGLAYVDPGWREKLMQMLAGGLSWFV